MRLDKQQVESIVDLYKRRKLGARNIARVMGITEAQAISVLLGKCYKKWTGGRVSHGRRKGVTNKEVWE